MQGMNIFPWVAELLTGWPIKVIIIVSDIDLICTLFQAGPDSFEV